MNLLLLLGVFLITYRVVSTCPARAAMSNFNTTRFLGTWYNIKRSSNARVTYKCFHNHFSTDEEGAVSMMTKYYNTSSASYISFPGVLNKMAAASPEAKFNLVRSDQANSFYVLGTDYTNYAVMWWCGPKRNTTEHIGEWAWRQEIYGDRTEHIAQTIFLKLHCARLCKRLYLMIVSTDVVTAAGGSWQKRGHTSLCKAVQETVSDDCQHRCSNCSWWLVAEEGTHFNTGKVGDVTLFRVRALRIICLGATHGGLRYKEGGRDDTNNGGFGVLCDGIRGRGFILIGCVTWVSSRSRTLDAKYQAKADQVLPPGDYLASDQSGCP
uniref:Uncharacterized protein n=1 Tax=Timema poppense TaxID=170557 RepID=A0A7R9HBZ7_TIMPO|nr:unnamed protein product [Timema poppensis]